MPRLVPSGLLAAAVLLVGCAGPEPPPVAFIPACEPYRDNPTTFGRCQLFASGQGADLIPAAGRAASLDAQIRCAHLRTSPEYYASCIERVEREHDTRVVAAPERNGPAAAADADPDDALARLLERVERLQDWRTVEPAAASRPHADTGEEASAAGL